LIGIFRVALLFICQGALPLSSSSSSAATLIGYHMLSDLSTTFFTFFGTFFQKSFLLSDSAQRILIIDY
ncbi:hypothetical protein, partial [uncultured Acetatifactor sp.]|uniref:hypothetical protein n=1 Tax=uncultured Acetatifactor sp. TaxID=1671927 RepID=UPI002611AA5A